LVQVPQRNLASQFQYKQLGVSLRSGSWFFLHGTVPAQSPADRVLALLALPVLLMLLV
jgi:hypothetical protein